MKRRNDPRYHVAKGKLDDDLAALLNAAARRADDDATLALRHGRIARKHIRAGGTHPKIADTVESARAFVDQGEKVLVFCDHHLPAVELTVELALNLRWPMTDGQRPKTENWRSAWCSIFSEIRREAELDDGREHSVTQLDHYLAWLMSDGVQPQIESWLGTDLQPTASSRDLQRVLERTSARCNPACNSIASHARQLYKQLVDRESGSTRAILLHDEARRLPGTTKARVAAVCEPEIRFSAARIPGRLLPSAAGRDTRRLQ